MNENIVGLELNIFDEQEIHYDCWVKPVYNQSTKEFDIMWSEYPIEEDGISPVYENCVVEIWKNSVTGTESIGWYQIAE
jgi:hypothetical protein